MSNSLSISDLTIGGLVKHVADGTTSPKLGNELADEALDILADYECTGLKEDLLRTGLKARMASYMHGASEVVGGQTVPMFISLSMHDTTEKQRLRFRHASLHQVKLWRKQRESEQGVKNHQHVIVNKSVDALLKRAAGSPGNTKVNQIFGD